jgi:transcriptional regulator with XRE-family HTH domain
MTLGERIKALRQGGGLTQRQLAEQTGLDFTYLSKIENDRLEHMPSIRVLQQLAAALDVDELELLDLADKVPPTFAPIVRDPEARRFFRSASAQAATSEDWRALTDYLERRQGSE